MSYEINIFSKLDSDENIYAEFFFIISILYIELSQILSFHIIQYSMRLQNEIKARYR